MVRKLIQDATTDQVFLVTLSIISPIVFYITWAFGGAVGLIILMFIAFVATSVLCRWLAVWFKDWADE